MQIIGTIPKKCRKFATIAAGKLHKYHEQQHDDIGSQLR